MIINNKQYEKVLFIHVPKTGGTSITKFLQENNLDNWVRICPTRHDPYFVLQDNNNIDKSIFTFAVVRNPYTRTYSYYHHFQRIHRLKLTFFEFLSFIRSRPPLNKTPWITYPQNYFLYDKNGKCNINKIYKFENIKDIENDFNCKLPKLNEGNYCAEDYLRDYDEKCISLVNHLYYQDFKLFNYSSEFSNQIKMEKTNSLREIRKVNIDELKYYVKNITDEEWNEWKLRQKKSVIQKHGVNLDTRTFPLIWSHPGGLEENEGKIYCHIMNQNHPIHDLIKPYYNFLEHFFDGRCIRVFLAELGSFKQIPTHIDISDTTSKAYRCHLPILTNDNVLFGINGKEYNLKEGILYEVNNASEHYVKNNSDQNRVHLLIDIIPNKYDLKIVKTCNSDLDL